MRLNLSSSCSTLLPGSLGVLGVVCATALGCMSPDATGGVSSSAGQGGAAPSSSSGSGPGSSSSSTMGAGGAVDPGPPTSLAPIVLPAAPEAGTAVSAVDAQAKNGTAIMLGSTGDSASVVLPADLPIGEYTVHMRLRGDGWAGPDGETWPRVAFALDGTDVAFATVFTQYGAACVGRLALHPGSHLTVRFLNDAYGGSPSTDRTVWVDTVDVVRQPDLSIVGVHSGDLLHGAVVAPRVEVGAGIVPAEVLIEVLDPHDEVAQSVVRKAPPFCSSAPVGGACAPWDTGPLADGDYTVRATATFADGARRVSTVGVAIANAKPQTYAPPLVITAGGTYSGAWESTDPAVAAVTIRTTDPVILEHSTVRGPGTLIGAQWIEGGVSHYLPHTRITVRNVRGFGTTPAKELTQKGAFVAIEEGDDLTVENNSMVSVGRGVYVRAFHSGVQPTDGVRIARNRVRDLDSRIADGLGGYLDRDPSWGNFPPENYPSAHVLLFQFVQFNGMVDQPNAEIGWNQVRNDPDVSRNEDTINLYGSGGKATSRMSIHDNYLEGAYPLHVERDTYSGGGILFGDGPGNEVRGYIDAFHNQVVGTVNYGMGILGGQSSAMYENRIVSTGMLPDGRRIAAQNVGLMFWDYAGGSKQMPPTFIDDGLSDNVVAWQAASGSPARNDWWMPACPLPGMTCKNNTALGGDGSLIPADIATTELAAWRAKLVASSIVIGPS